ncbi:MAG: DUF3108 domain-containing protein [Spirochaetes bacterium]|jgi:hypothetical protein|nr:DUF3108 domain-containing protein [Spirochaetota bacterium]
MKRTIKKTIATVFMLISFEIFGELLVNDGETFTYVTTLNKTTEQNSCTYRNTNNGYTYIYTSANESWQVKTYRSGRPQTVKHNIRGNELSFVYNANSVSISGIWAGDAINNEKRYDRLVTSENALLLRTHDFTKNPEMVFEMQQPDYYPLLETMTMQYIYEGTETVTVPAGTFECKKIRFTLTGIKKMFFSAYYYITDDARQIIVKTENMPRNGKSELVKIVSAGE